VSKEQQSNCKKDKATAYALQHSAIEML